MKIVIVGGVAGGASAATRLRRLSESAEIVLFEKSEFISYANCGLPYYIGGAIRERDRLVVTKPELLRDRFSIDVRTQSEVTAINRAEKTVTVVDRKSGNTYRESYDKLLLSPGASPKVLPIPGVDLPGVFTLRTIPDTYAIDDYIRTQEPQKAVVVGGGFIGVEIAENLKERGLSVTIVEFLDQVLTFLDREIVATVHQTLRSSGVELILSAGVSAIERDGSSGKMTLKLSDNGVLSADLVLLCTGVSPDGSLAASAGLPLGPAGSIVVDDSFATSDPDIFAVGDAIAVRSFISGKEVLVPLAGPANRQGRDAAAFLLGLDEKVKPGAARTVQGSSVVKVFDLIAAATGFSEKQLIREGIPYMKTLIHPASHATYYPNSTNMSMKMLFSPEGRILGAQAVGYDGVEKRIDVIATAIRLGGTVFDLEELELCYAPPVSSAKDPVNMLGFTASNILRGDVSVFYAEQVDKLLTEGAYFLDVSTPDEIAMGTIPGAHSIPLDSLRTRLGELPADRPIYTFCRVGLRGYVAVRLLKQHGYDARNLSGGYRTYNLLRKEAAAVSCDRSSSTKSNGNGETNMTDNASQTRETPSAAPALTIAVDACGLSCPGPIMKVAESIRSVSDGDVLRITATDPAFASDIDMWCQRTGNTLLSVNRDKGIFTVDLKKGVGADRSAPSVQTAGNDKTMVIFSGDLDKAIAAFIIANGAAAMGRKVTMFFTFWGLNILRKSTHVPVKKNLVEKMFGVMMPRGSKKLGLSRMNMGGMGAKMIRAVMKQKNVQSLEELIRAAMANGVHVQACQMSMDIMGIHQEELLEGVELAGVATFLGSAETSDTNLFI